MEFFFNPQSIAVIGATPTRFKNGYSILRNLMSGYQGKVYPVNPRYEEALGFPCFPSVRAIPDKVDLAIIIVPAAMVPQAVEECAARGVPGVMIESGGFAEIGPKGKILQQQLVDIAKRTGIRIWGPNCMGLVDAKHGYVFSFMHSRKFREQLTAGRVSLVVQSGMLSAAFLVDLMSNGLMGISKVCSVGNKVDVNECDVLEYLLADPDTGVVGLYLESFVDGRRFMELCRRSAKPVVVLKGGKSRKGAEAAMSHTASLAGNQRIISGALAQAGVREAKDFRQMADICRSLAIVPPRPAGQTGRIAVLTFSGGAGILSADFIEEMGLSVADLAEETYDQLRKLFPEWRPVSNPVDLYPVIEDGTDVFGEAVKAALADPGVDAVFFHSNTGEAGHVQKMADLSKAAGKPLFIWTLGTKENTYEMYTIARACELLVYQDIYRACECMAAVFQQPKPTDILSERQERTTTVSLNSELQNIIDTAAGPLDEYVSKNILKACGVPTVEEQIVTSTAQAKETASCMGMPVVMKGLQPGGVHKTELGLVDLDIKTGRAAGKSYSALMKKMKGTGRVLMQKQVHGKVELIIGLVRDSQFGPCVMFGVGGIMAEVLDDVVFAVAPLTHRDALNLIARLRSRKLLNGFRGAPPVNRDEMAQILVAVGDLGAACPRIREIDVNPLIITDNGPVAVDTTIVLKEPENNAS
ncbi:MAG: acetate--CoA ligase family protein [Deltaproteobacteria bacterium]|nr:acetate--CoA ligase family protein [Deltaproteobacteria bacterium]